MTFEGKDVTFVEEVRDPKTKQITHCLLSVMEERGEVVQRTFTQAEMEQHWNSERLVIDRDYYSLSRELDRLVGCEDGVIGKTKKQRDRIDRCMFLARRMKHYHDAGMLLTPERVETKRHLLEREYRRFQSMRDYGTERTNTLQRIHPLPSNTTLLLYYRQFRSADGSARAFAPASVEFVNDFENLSHTDKFFVLCHLHDYIAKPEMSKNAVASNTRDQVLIENQRREAAGYHHLINVKSVRTYERWIDHYLDPFMVMAARKGIAAAQAHFSINEVGLTATLPGERVVFDGWQIHTVTLAKNREEWKRMTPEERKNVKRVRRWNIVAIDVATRCILGFALCRAPCQSASLEALRMCFTDKTDILRKAGIRLGGWDLKGPVQLVVTDSGSEFGKTPFGGARFTEATRRLSGSLMSTVAGIPKLRAHVERLFRTFDFKWARHQAGYTASNPQALGDRKPHEEACMTDDELYVQMVSFMAEYHNDTHAGIGGFTPAGMWEKLSKDRAFDRSAIPGPRELREACGEFATVRLSEDGIRFEGARYSNELVRKERLKSGFEQFAKQGDKFEILYDPANLGAISIVTEDELIPVPAVNPEMSRKSLQDWKAERSTLRKEARDDVDKRAPARVEAHNHWKGQADVIAAVSGAKDGRPGLKELQRAALETTMGKGHHEMPAIGRDEGLDPVTSGYRINPDGEDDVYVTEEELAVQTEVQPDAPSALDRFRKSITPKKPHSKGT
ncbi:MAG: hypothetical protein N4A70_01195 [Pelagimonas sp.]|jgi:hypothetical protein|nr:hypothetical protein [Pelagimonas sp.]